MSANWYLILSFLITWLWSIGVNVGDVTRGLAAIGIILLIFKRDFFYTDNKEDLLFSTDTSKFTKLFWFSSVTVILILTVGLIARVYLGYHGMDHAIFSQVATSLSEGNGFYSTFNRGRPTSFIHDHFGVILLGPALLIRLGIFEPLAVIIWQGLGYLLALIAVWRIARKRGLSELSAGFAILIFICIGDIRSQAVWSTQLEYMALPLTLWAWERWLHRRHWQSIFIALLAALTKETVILWSGAFALSVIVIETLRYKAVSNNQKTAFLKAITPYLLLLLITVTGFLLYTYGQKYLFGKEYDYLYRIEPESLLDPKILFQKTGYMLHFFLFALFYPLRQRKYWPFLIPLVPTLLMVAITNSDHMWQLGRQYVTLPAAVVFTAALLVLNKKDLFLQTTSVTKLGTLLICLAFSIGMQKPAKSIYKLFSLPLLEAPTFELSDEETVGVSWSSAQFMLKRENIYHVQKVESPHKEKMNYIILRPTEEDLLSVDLKSKFSICNEDKHWQLYCRR